MADKEKRTLFGMDSDELADALEAIYKKQREHAQLLEEIKMHVMALRTTVLPDGATQAAQPGGVSDDGDAIPPMVKWALSQPWGVNLMHSLTDQEMLGGLAKALVDWLKNKAVQKVAEAAAKSAAGGGAA